MGDRNRGVYKKYRVYRLDGSGGDGGKHANCDYFVLDLCHDKHALPAMRAYIQSCRADRPRLAHELEVVMKHAEVFVNINSHQVSV